jgi:hypothetical protein
VLTWSISFDEGDTYTQFAQSTHQILTTYSNSLTSSTDYYVNTMGQPYGNVNAAQLLAVTAARISYATGLLASYCTPSGAGSCSQDKAMVDTVVAQLFVFPGFSFQSNVLYNMSTLGNYWAMLDGSGVAADCISLAGLAGLLLGQVGIQSDSHFAYPTGVVQKAIFTDTVNQAPLIGTGKTQQELVYLDDGDCENVGEGFLRATVSGTQMAWTVFPTGRPFWDMLPVSSSSVQPTVTWSADGNTYNNQLFYRVLYNVITTIQSLNPGTLLGQQVWTLAAPTSNCNNPHSAGDVVPLPVPIYN